MSQIQLRDYQLEALEAVQKEYDLDIRRQLIVLPTGTGKTYLFAGITKHFNKRTLILAHRDELLKQAKDKIQKYWPESDIGIVQSSIEQYDHQIVIGSLQSCAYPHRIEQLKQQHFEVLIVDEAHHVAAECYQRILKQLGFMDESGTKLLLGFTATPERADKLGLGDTFQKIVFMRSIATMITQGYLCPVNARRCLTSVSLDKVGTIHGDFNLGQLISTVNVKERNEFIVSKYSKYACGRKAIAFCTNIQHCHDLAKAFNEHGIAAKAIWGNMHTHDREQTLEDLKYGNIDVCTSCGVLTEGFDEPTVNCILMARPTKSRGLYQQMLGRGLRPAEGKFDCLVIDFADEVHDLNSIMTLQKSLPELPKIEDDEEQQLKEKLSKPTNVPVFEVYDAAFNILGRSAFIWVDIGDGEYSLMDDDHKEIILEPVGDGNYTATLWNKSESLHIFEQALPLEYARTICEDYARQHLKIKYCESHTWLHNVGSLPPTEGQIKILAKHGISAKDMNKAQASIAIRKALALHNKQLRKYAGEPMTAKQKFYLESKGVKTAGMNKTEAIKMIALLKQGMRPASVIFQFSSTQRK